MAYMETVHMLYSRRRKNLSECSDLPKISISLATLFQFHVRWLWEMADKGKFLWQISRLIWIQVKEHENSIRE